MPIYKNIIQEANHERIKQYVTKQQKLQRAITQLHNSRWDDFRERRETQVKLYVSRMRVMRMCSQLVVIAMAQKICRKLHRAASALVTLRRYKMLESLLSVRIMMMFRFRLKRRYGEERPVEAATKNRLRYSLVLLGHIEMMVLEIHNDESKSRSLHANRFKIRNKPAVRDRNCLGICAVAEAHDVILKVLLRR